MDTNDRTTKTLLVCGALAGPLFTAAWIIEGTLTAHYDPPRPERLTSVQAEG
jgi:hypothetical protein